MLETKVVFKAHEKIEKDQWVNRFVREYTRDVIITGRNMDDINHQAQKVAQYLNEQTGMTWVIEVSDYKDIEI